MILMTALKAMPYGGKTRKPGDTFAVTGPRDARLLEAVGKATRYVEPVKPERKPRQPKVMQPEAPADAAPEAPADAAQEEPAQEFADTQPAEEDKPRRVYRRRDVVAE